VDEVAFCLIGDRKGEDFFHRLFHGIHKGPQLDVTALPNGVSCPRISSLGLPEASQIDHCPLAEAAHELQMGVTGENARPVGLTLRGYSAHDSQSEEESKGGSIMASGTGLLVVWTDIASEYEADFNEWYDKEHIPQLLGVPGFQTGRRYQAVEGAPKYAAIYQLADENVLKSDGFRAVRENPTAWTKKITLQFRNTQRGSFGRFSRTGPDRKETPSSC
jgi:hypothetical protein